MTEERFDQLLKEMREESAPPEQAAAARDRVWEHLAGATSRACTEFRAELSAYVAGGIAESRRLLIEDHLGRCPECRRALAGEKGERQVLSLPPAPRERWPNWTCWAVAAGAVLAVLYLGREAVDSALAPSGPRATVISATGGVYRLHPGQAPESALATGAALAEGDVVRTTAGSRAMLQLSDGSRLEMNERTEVAVRAAWSGQTIRLDRGDIIVEAAPQRRGRLRVVTGDSIASVQGTVFAVSSGTAGSVVAVVEGSVEVSQPGSRRILTRGQQAATHRALEQIGVRHATSWSQNAERYFALLAEFSQIEKELAQTAPALRTEARLLRYLPAGVEVYFAVPNLEGTIRQALYLVDQRARENAVLHEWWSSAPAQELRENLDRIQAAAPYLGEEVLFVLAADAARANGKIPLLLAQIQPDRQEALRQALDRIAEDQARKLPYQISPKGLLLVSDSATHLGMMSAQLGAGAGSAFASEIARRYEAGVSWLAGIDVAALGRPLQQTTQGRLLGLPNMGYLFFEQRWGRGRDDNEAVLSFQGLRTGIASWLAPPGSAGSLTYVSAEAVLALSASTRNPQQAFHEIVSLTGQDDEFAANLRKFEAETGINVGGDIAGSLGTDFTLAVERFSLPIPGWVAIFEVVRPDTLEDTVRRLADSFNRSLGPEDAGHRMSFTQETVNGRSWSALQAGGGPMTVYWTHDRGYLIASMDRALAARAIGIREAGTSLTRSAAFQERFPVTGGMHHSGFLWLNTSGVLAELAGLVESPAVRSLLGSREPVLVVVDGEMERIHAASRTRLTSLILDLMLAGGSGRERL
jgi:hypothetical protein